MSVASTSPQPFRRDRVTWGGYLTLALFTFFLNIQGNVIPFLRDSFGLSYGVVSLHPAMLAVGLIICGFIGERAVARLGRRGALAVGIVGLAFGAVLFVVAVHPVMTLAACLAMGCPGGLILTAAPALLAQLHGENRNAALGEANGICYIASLGATLLMGAITALGLDWRDGIGLGIALAAVLVLSYRHVRVPEPIRVERHVSNGRLPAVYWVYWAALFAVISLEQTTLLWAPAFLEGVRGFDRSTAATVTGVFSLGMLIGRLSAGILLARASAPRLLYLSLALTVPGLALYWGAGAAALSVIGLFVVGLGTALLYPLTLGIAIGSVGPLGDAASTRASLASGAAILIMPAALGALADHVGLSFAHLALPVMVVAAVVCLLIARRMAGRSRVV